MEKRKKGNWSWAKGSSLLLMGSLLALLAWWILSLSLEAGGNLNLPDPWKTIGRAFECLFVPGEAGKTWLGIGWTTFRLFLSFLLSLALALVLGTLAGLFPSLRTLFRPGVTLLKAVPTIAAAVLLSSLLFGPGYGERAPYIPVFLGLLVIFPIQYEAVLSGFDGVGKEEREALRLEGGERSFLALRQVYGPGALPYLLLSFAQSLGLGLKVILMAEITVGSSVGEGLGELIRENTAPIYDMGGILAYSLIAILLVLLADGALAFLKKKLEKEVL